MTWGIPTAQFLQLHVVLSFVGMLTGLVVLYELLKGRLSPAWTGAFLATTIATSVTGFPLPPFGFDPPRAVGILSLLLLAVALLALYVFELAGRWRAAFIVTALAALYLNVFVGVVQAFQKIAVVQQFAPTQSEPPFLIAQGALLLLFVVFIVLALRRSAQLHA